MKLRPVEMSDAQLLFDWRNDPLTRSMSVNPDPVEWDGHVIWLEVRLARETPGLFIAEDQEPVGTVRLDGDEISYTVAPAHRGKGVATTMLALARDTFGPKVAKVKPGNYASIKAATTAGHAVQIIAV